MFHCTQKRVQTYLFQSVLLRPDLRDALLQLRHVPDHRRLALEEVQREQVGLHQEDQRGCPKIGGFESGIHIIKRAALQAFIWS